MTPKNMAASVHARLMAGARKTGRPFQELLQFLKELVFRAFEGGFGNADAFGSFRNRFRVEQGGRYERRSPF